MTLAATPHTPVFLSRYNPSHVLELLPQPRNIGHNLREQQQQQQPFNGRMSGTTRVGRYQKEHSPARTHPDQRASFITFLYLPNQQRQSTKGKQKYLLTYLLTYTYIMSDSAPAPVMPAGGSVYVRSAEG